MRLITRIAALHSVYWGFDRWYRLSWYVWPAALALLVCGWICIDKAGGAPFPPGSAGASGAGSTAPAWAKPFLPNTNNALPNTNNAPTQSNWVQQELTKCFSSDPLAASCSGLINTGQVRGRQLAAVYTQRGFIQRQKQPDLAMADYASALKVQPYFADALSGRAWIRMTRGEYDAALEDLNKAIDVLPPISSGAARYYRGYAFLKLEDYPKALADLNEAQKYQPNNPDIYLARGEVEQAQADNEAALSDFDQFVKRAPKDPRGQVWRSWVLEATGRTQDALAAMESALALEPGNETARAERDRLQAKLDEVAHPK